MKWILESMKGTHGWRSYKRAPNLISQEMVG